MHKNKSYEGDTEIMWSHVVNTLEDKLIYLPTDNINFKQLKYRTGVLWLNS